MKVFGDAFILLLQMTVLPYALYDYWVLGRNAAEREPRWSVIRNVLHLVD